METTAYLRKLANQGNADAQFRIGYRLAFGKKKPKTSELEGSNELVAESC